MKLLKKLLPFLLVFSIIFYFLRTNDAYNTKVLIADLGGIPWLYAAVSTIFGIIAAFSIQKEWESWNNLVYAVKSEVDGLEKLHIWSKSFPNELRVKVHTHIVSYLQLLTEEGWHFNERGIRSPQVESVFDQLNEDVFEISSIAPQLMSTSFALLSRILDSRSKRLLYSSQHTPALLKSTLRLGAFLLIGLSLFIGVKNFWLAYVYTASIASLSFAVFVVLYDLDKPLSPGDWQVTTKDYEELLHRIEPNEV